MSSSSHSVSKRIDDDDPYVTLFEYTGKDDVQKFIATYIISNNDEDEDEDEDEDKEEDAIKQNSISLKGLPNYPGNHCFLNCALQTVVWLAQLGPLRFIIDDWATIVTHHWLSGLSGDDGENVTRKRRSTRIKHPFVKLFEMLLINKDNKEKVEKVDV